MLRTSMRVDVLKRQVHVRHHPLPPVDMCKISTVQDIAIVTLEGE